MKKFRIAIVAGTRPEAIKMAPIYFACKQSEILVPEFVATAQHRQMLDQTLACFGIVPDRDLDLMQAGQTLESLTRRVIEAMSRTFRDERPDAVLVQGDTTTVLATALAAFYHQVPIGHVEAGLRTGNMHSPFPEEMNRRLTSPLVQWHFCPTAQGQENLAAENIRDRVFVTGNSVIDALLWIKKKLEVQGRTSEQIAQATGIPEDFRRPYLESTIRPWILVTGHRRESFGDGFERICRAILKVVERHPDVGVLYPVHLNPNVREPVNRILGASRRIALVEPIGYEDFVWLMNRCSFLLSDSGGVQEEAPSLGKPVLVMRETTERPEGVAAGTCRLVGTSIDRIVAECSILLQSESEYDLRSRLANPYGDGQTGNRIIRILEDHFAPDATNKLPAI